MNNEEECKKLVSKMDCGHDVKTELVAKIEEGYDVNYVSNGTGSLLHRAASSADAIDLVRLLISSHADVNIKNAQHDTPLHNTSLPDAYAIAELLIENDADVNSRNKDGDMPIHKIARESSLDLLKLLIKNGADVNARGCKNKTPLHYAAGKLSSDFFARRTDAAPIVNELITHGADVNAINVDGDTPLHIASMSGAENVIDMLLMAGANNGITNSYGDKPEDCVFSLSTLYLGETLRSAIRNTVRKHLKALLRKEAQLMQSDDYGIVNRTKWDKELEYFVMHVLAPSLDSSNTYIKWVLHNIDDENINHENARTELMRTIEEALEQAPYDYEGTSYSDDMGPIEYENMCADILADGGWKTKMTSASGDQGVDIYAEKNGKSIVLQCKMYSSPVGNKAVQEAYAGMGFMGASRAIVVTNSSYTQSAKQLATSLGVLLLHHDELGDLGPV